MTNLCIKFEIPSVVPPIDKKGDKKFTIEVVRGGYRSLVVIGNRLHSTAS